MPRPIYAEIDIQALKHNLARLRESVGDRTLWAVVKANAYGHGLENAVEAFADADGFATIDLCDAERARRAGWHKRVLLLEGFFDETDIEPLQDLDVETVVHSMWQIDILKRLQLREVKVHIKVNSGMNRLGFLPVEVGTIYDLLTSIPGVKVIARRCARIGLPTAHPHGQARAFRHGGLHGQLRCHPLASRSGR